MLSLWDLRMYICTIANLVEKYYPYGIFYSHSLPAITHFFCISSYGKLCKWNAGIVTGYSDDDDAKKITYETVHTPAGTSVKSIDIYSQYMGDKHHEDPGNILYIKMPIY